MGKVTEESIRDGFADGKCQCCGESSSALWQERTRIELCANCIRHIFPALLADSINYPSRDRACSILNQAAVRFWEVVAHNIGIENRNLKNELIKLREELNPETKAPENAGIW